MATKKTIIKKVAKKATPKPVAKKIEKKKVITKKVVAKVKPASKKVAPKLVATKKTINKKAVPNKKVEMKKTTIKREPLNPMVYELNEAQMTNLIAKGRSRGFVTETELLYVFPFAEEYVYEYELFLENLQKNGIQIIEEDH